MATLPVSTASVAPGYCFTTWPESWPYLVSLLSVSTVEAGTSIHVGTTPPADSTQLFFYLAPGGPQRLYYNSNGVWVALHPLPEGTTMIAPATITNISQLQTYDGGEASGSPPYAGPMWIEDEDFRNAFPLGKGSIAFPSGLNPAVGDTGGEERHVNLLAEIPFHDHQYTKYDDLTFSPGSGGAVIPHQTNLGGRTGGTGGDGTALNATTSHQNMPPYRVRIFMKRSGRTHYRF